MADKAGCNQGVHRSERMGLEAMPEAWRCVRKDHDHIARKVVGQAGEEMATPLLNSSPYWPLFQHMSKAHGLTLLDSELEDIRRIALVTPDSDNLADYRRKVGMFVLNQLSEVTNHIGGVIGYELKLNAEETEELMKLIDS